MHGYDYIDRHGYCEECGAGWFVTGDLGGCSSSSCDFYVSAQEHYDSQEPILEP